MAQLTKNSKIIKATAETIFKAFTNPLALEVWQAPVDMTSKVHNFDLRVGGRYEMSLYYPDYEKVMQGKTSKNEDRFTATFLELQLFKRNVQSIKFDSPFQILQKK